ncbi:MAG: ATP-binding protein [Sphingomonas sp.]|uniref:ATP-binding protein n=1 Tax=Sphingomonas sp. TaxID=28214 RepID=UPI0012263F71|nr:ATP-binding protein [Sphingomonas sp.]THD34489.1 MAG: ATP-binding protein [Sphingomonas sp.]
MADDKKGVKHDFPHAPLTQAEQALESSRDSGFDLSAAAGELVDNSYEAGAQHIRIATIRDDDGSIVELGVADDGSGIPPDLLASVLSLGYSSRYNSRQSLGRFGMGLKLASLSQAQRVEVHTKVAGDDRVFSTHLDLAEVRSGEQTDLNVTDSAAWPEEFVELMKNPATGQPFASGTLVIWRDIDRLQEGGRFGTSVSEKVVALRKFLARAYRRFIDKGLRIELDGQEVTLHDPLFLLDNPRVTQKFPDVPKAQVIDNDEFPIDGKIVKWTVTLLPKEFREKPNLGGRATKGREAFADLNIPDNESRVSMLRNGREIYYDLVPKLYPGGGEKIDRYIGVEIDFPATLDEYFQVRNVKRGAEPVSKLREELRKALEKPIKRARKDIRAYWQEVQQKEQVKTGDEHVSAHDIADGFEQTAPAGRANLDKTEEEVNQALVEIVADMGLDPEDPASAEKANWVRDSFDKRAVTILNGQWPGKDMLDIRHLSGKAIVSVNDRHPFMSELVAPLKAMAKVDAEELDLAEVSTLLNRLSVGVDLLLMAYAKAENMHADPDDAYGELRTHWGLFTAGLIREAVKRYG